MNRLFISFIAILSLTAACSNDSNSPAADHNAGGGRVAATDSDGRCALELEKDFWSYRNRFIPIIVELNSLQMDVLTDQSIVHSTQFQNRVDAVATKTQSMCEEIEGKWGVFICRNMDGQMFSSQEMINSCEQLDASMKELGNAI